MMSPRKRRKSSVLPAAAPSPPPDRSVDEQDFRSTNLASHIAKKTHPQVLLVYNNPTDLYHAELTLTKIGCIVHDSTDVRSAFNKWKHPKNYDVVFVECTVGSSTGIELARQIRVAERAQRQVFTRGGNRYVRKDLSGAIVSEPYDERKHTTTLIGMWRNLEEKEEMNSCRFFTELFRSPLETKETLLASLLITPGQQLRIETLTAIPDVLELLDNGDFFEQAEDAAPEGVAVMIARAKRNAVDSYDNFGVELEQDGEGQEGVGFTDPAVLRELSEARQKVAELEVQNELLEMKVKHKGHDDMRLHKLVEAINGSSDIGSDVNERIQMLVAENLRLRDEVTELHGELDKLRQEQAGKEEDEVVSEAPTDVNDFEQCQTALEATERLMLELCDNPAYCGSGSALTLQGSLTAPMRSHRAGFTPQKHSRPRLSGGSPSGPRGVTLQVPAMGHSLSGSHFDLSLNTDAASEDASRSASVVLYGDNDDDSDEPPVDQSGFVCGDDELKASVAALQRTRAEIDDMHQYVIEQRNGQPSHERNVMLYDTGTSFKGQCEQLLCELQLDFLTMLMNACRGAKALTLARARNVSVCLLRRGQRGLLELQKSFQIKWEAAVERAESDRVKREEALERRIEELVEGGHGVGAQTQSVKVQTEKVHFKDSRPVKMTTTAAQTSYDMVDETLRDIMHPPSAARRDSAGTLDVGMSFVKEKSRILGRAIALHHTVMAAVTYMCDKFHIPMETVTDAGVKVALSTDVMTLLGFDNSILWTTLSAAERQRVMNHKLARITFQSIVERIMSKKYAKKLVDQGCDTPQGRGVLSPKQALLKTLVEQSLKRAKRIDAEREVIRTQREKVKKNAPVDSEVLRCEVDFDDEEVSSMEIMSDVGTPLASPSPEEAAQLVAAMHEKALSRVEKSELSAATPVFSQYVNKWKSKAGIKQL